MNKQLIAALMAAGLGVASSMAFAAPTAFQGNQAVTGGVGNDCPLLAEDVTLGVSKNVHGAYNCDEADNLVQVAACSEGGSRQVGVACIDLDPLLAGDQLPPGCNALGGNSTIPDYKAFFTSSEGGVMAEYQLGQRCGAGTIVGIDGFD